MTAELDNNPGAHRDAATAIARQRATPWRVNLCLARASPSCIALRAGSLLAAPSGPSAMCFLRHARGFGWLDPSLRRRSRRLLDTKAASPRKWDMRGRCPSRFQSSCSRIKHAEIFPCFLALKAQNESPPFDLMPRLHGQASTSSVPHSLHSPDEK